MWRILALGGALLSGCIGELPPEAKDEVPTEELSVEKAHSGVYEPRPLGFRLPN